MCIITFFSLCSVDTISLLAQYTLSEPSWKFLCTQGECMIKELLALLSVFFTSVIKGFVPTSPSLLFEDEAGIVEKKENHAKMVLFVSENLQSA